jgi:hypothetical protein
MMTDIIGIHKKKTNQITKTLKTELTITLSQLEESLIKLFNNRNKWLSPPWTLVTPVRRSIARKSFLSQTKYTKDNESAAL